MVEGADLPNANFTALNPTVSSTAKSSGASTSYQTNLMPGFRSVIPKSKFTHPSASVKIRWKPLEVGSGNRPKRCNWTDCQCGIHSRWGAPEFLWHRR